MVMQSGDVPAGGEDSKSAKPLPWKYILIAAVLAASILGIFAATSGIFSSDPAIDASTNSISGASQPATNPIVFTDNEEDKTTTTAKQTKATPNPKLIENSANRGYQNLKDASTGLLFDEKYFLYIVNFKIDTNSAKITGAIENRGKESATVHPFRIIYQSELGHEIPSPNDQTIKWQGKVTRSKFTGPKYQGILIEPNKKVYFVLEMKSGYNEYLEELNKKGIQPQYVNFITK